MNYPPELKYAARAFERIVNPKLHAAYEIEQCDAGFDGGEWSGSFHADVQQEIVAQTMAEVAERFGVSVSDLENYQHMQEGPWHSEAFRASMENAA